MNMIIAIISYSYELYSISQEENKATWKHAGRSLWQVCFMRIRLYFLLLPVCACCRRCLCPTSNTSSNPKQSKQVKLAVMTSAGTAPTTESKAIASAVLRSSSASLHRKASSRVLSPEHAEALAMDEVTRRVDEEVELRVLSAELMYLEMVIKFVEAAEAYDTTRGGLMKYVEEIQKTETNKNMFFGLDELCALSRDPRANFDASALISHRHSVTAPRFDQCCPV